MAHNVYEGMFLLDSNKTQGDWNNVTRVVHGILQRNQAELIASRPWEERRLAYPMDGHKRGMYLLTYFKTDGRNLEKIDHDCRLNETVLRQLVLKVHPKLVEQLVAQAMAPHENPPVGVDREEPRERDRDDGPRGRGRDRRDDGDGRDDRDLR